MHGNSNISDYPRFFLGVDGGGTRCRVRLCDHQGKILGEKTSGPANICLGLDTCFETIISATACILSEIGLGLSALSSISAGLGLAGILHQDDIDRVEYYPHPFHSVYADSDAAAACLGAHNGKDGGIVILGTGSQALAILNGEKTTVGGWGFTLSDHGSGAQLGLQTLRTALLANECTSLQTPFTKAVMNQFNNSALELFSWSQDKKPCDYGVFALTAADFAQQNDSTAISLVRQSAKDAEHLIRALINIGVHNIVLHGGLCSLLKPYFDKDLFQFFCSPQNDPLAGALSMAMRSRGDNY